MNFYEGYHVWGMHLIWWFVWVLLLIWIFATPWSIPGERRNDAGAMDILKKRFAGGSITNEEYERKKEILLRDKNL